MTLVINRTEIFFLLNDNGNRLMKSVTDSWCKFSTGANNIGYKSIGSVNDTGAKKVEIT